MEFFKNFSKQTKTSPIFVKFAQLKCHKTVSSEPFEFLQYLYPFQRYARFSYYFIFNSAQLFKNIFLRKLHHLK